jgi:hypothetical protein
MAIVYNQIGSLTELLSRCKYKGIDFNSFEEIIEFLSGYDRSLADSSVKARRDLDKEVENIKIVLSSTIADRDLREKAICEILDKKLLDLDTKINGYKAGSSNPITRIIPKIRLFLQLKKREHIRTNYEIEKNNYLRETGERIKKLQEELNDKSINYDKLAIALADKYVSRLKFIYSALAENGSFVFGTKGEYMALQELKKLPDSYSIINNVCFRFHRGVHDKKNDDWIYSAQIDHVVVGPTGLFLIETKNWSQESAANVDLFSPVKQITRSGHAVYVVLNDAVQRGFLGSFDGQWGAQKVSVRKIILLTGYNPGGEYEFVKLLKLSEIKSYITYGKVVLNEGQVKSLVEYFLDGSPNNN